MDLFDLNIEKVLDHWGVEHALREIIANALDEQKLSNTREISIVYKDGTCKIRDYGRGIQYRHFTQNEDPEKNESQVVIGKFGVGLKDALGVFHRHGIQVIINSRYATIHIIMAEKAGFDVSTLHAAFEEPQNPEMDGTEFCLIGIEKSDLEKAEAMFLDFNKNVKLLETNKFGEVYEIVGADEAVIYANGVQIAKEENFMFSYNITGMNSQMKKALNRERSNVGRTAYTPSIRNILRNCTSDEVMTMLVKDIKNVMQGTNKDESGWADISAYAVETLNESGKVVFMTPTQRDRLSAGKVEILQESGKELILITDKVFKRVSDNVTTYDDVEISYYQRFRYEFVDEDDFTEYEKKVYRLSGHILSVLLSKYKRNRPDLRISETIRLEEDGTVAKGVWDSAENSIIIKREVLSDVEEYAGVLFHEFAHYATRTKDITREFENVLTDMLGYIYIQYLEEGRLRQKTQRDLSITHQAIDENNKLKADLRSLQNNMKSESSRFENSLQNLQAQIEVLQNDSKQMHRFEEENKELKKKLSDIQHRSNLEHNRYDSYIQGLHNEIKELKVENSRLSEQIIKDRKNCSFDASDINSTEGGTNEEAEEFVDEENIQEQKNIIRRLLDFFREDKD